MLTSNTMLANIPFVQGMLEEMQGSYSIYYEMVFHLSTGHTTPVFYNYSRHEPKTDEQISSQLTVGASYEMLIIVRTRHPAYMPANPSGEAFELVDWEVQEGKTYSATDSCVTREST